MSDLPDDATQAVFSDVALARLALSSELAELAERARSWVDPRHETGSADVEELLTKVAGMTHMLDAIRTRAVIYARERHLSWADIAEALGVSSRATPQERYAPAVARWRDELYAGDLRAAVGTEDPVRRAQTLDRWVVGHRAPADGRFADGEQAVSATLRRRDPRTATTAVGGGARILEWSTEATARSTWLNAKIRAGERIDPQARAAVAAHRRSAEAAFDAWQAETELRRRGPWTAWIRPRGDDDADLSFTVSRIGEAPPDNDFLMARWSVRVEHAAEPVATGTIDAYVDDDAAQVVAETIRLVLGVEHIRGDIQTSHGLSPHHERIRAVLEAEHRGDFHAVAAEPA